MNNTPSVRSPTPMSFLIVDKVEGKGKWQDRNWKRYGDEVKLGDIITDLLKPETHLYRLEDEIAKQHTTHPIGMNRNFSATTERNNKCDLLDDHTAAEDLNMFLVKGETSGSSLLDFSLERMTLGCLAPFPIEMGQLDGETKSRLEGGGDAFLITGTIMCDGATVRGSLVGETQSASFFKDTPQGRRLFAFSVAKMGLGPKGKVLITPYTPPEECRLYVYTAKPNLGAIWGTEQEGKDDGPALFL